MLSLESGRNSINNSNLAAEEVPFETINVQLPQKTATMNQRRNPIMRNRTTIHKNQSKVLDDDEPAHDGEAVCLSDDEMSFDHQMSMFRGAGHNDCFT